MTTRYRQPGNQSYDLETERELARQETVAETLRLLQTGLRVGSRHLTTGWFFIPGLHSGSAYTSGDAMGTRFDFPAPVSGVIDGVDVIDQDNERLAFDILLFSEPFTGTADDAAMDVSDADMSSLIGVISITAADFAALNDNAVASAYNIGRRFTAPSGRIWAQCVTRGVQNLTAVTDYKLKITIVSD